MHRNSLLHLMLPEILILKKAKSIKCLSHCCGLNIIFPLKILYFMLELCLHCGGVEVLESLEVVSSGKKLSFEGFILMGGLILFHRNGPCLGGVN